MQVQVFVPIALKPQPMLQSTVQGAPVLASEVVQLMSVDEPPPAPVVGEPPDPEPPAPVVVDSPAAPVLVVEEVPLAPLVVDEVPELVVDEAPAVPLTGEVPLPSVLLEQPEGAQR
jgi:hypothetical protein